MNYFGVVKAMVGAVFLYSAVRIVYRAEETRKYFHGNWCGEIPVEDCGYWVGGILDYAALTNSAFHTGWSLDHLLFVSSIVAFIVVNQIELLDMLDKLKEAKK